MSDNKLPFSRRSDAESHAHVEPPPSLWNPTAAGCWSLVFSPIFGAYLHMKNWQALGQMEQATKSKNWAIGSLAFLAFLSVALPDTKEGDVFLRLAGFALLVGWYYAIGKSQQTYIAARYGKGYPRRGWTKPLLAALLVFIIFSFAVAFATVQTA